MMPRCLEREWIDEPSLDDQQHVQALRGLERINWASNSSRLLWPAIRELARTQRGRSLRVLDIATGAGDIPLQLWRRARRAGLRLQIEGCDRSPRAVEHSRLRATRAGADIRFFPLDALDDEIPATYDVLICSLFLHHLQDEEAVQVLRRMGRATRHLVLANDLVRHPAGLALAYVGTRLLSGSDVVHHDGPQSVRAAYTVEEARRLAGRAGLEGATVASRWPCRFLLVWKKRF